ncbi:MAG: hypothetical protein P9L96_03835 [Candidatus Gygaella obscura]|nr:hypothetical protein [Candidatus Gygaella obscura]
MNKKPPLLYLFSIVNIILSVSGIILFFNFFYMTIIVGWVTDVPIDTIFLWIRIFILQRLALILVSFCLALLFWAGVSLLFNRIKAVKLTKTALMGVSLGVLIYIVDGILFSSSSIKLDYFLKDCFFVLLFFSYSFIQVYYLNTDTVTSLFDDTDIRLRYDRYAIVVFIILGFSWLMSLISSYFLKTLF